MTYLALQDTTSFMHIMTVLLNTAPADFPPYVTKGLGFFVVRPGVWAGVNLTPDVRHGRVDQCETHTGRTVSADSALRLPEQYLVTPFDRYCAPQLHFITQPSS
jgi:hypothetical protein